MNASCAVLLAVAFVATVLPTTNAIKCYQCASETSSNCGGTRTDCGSSYNACSKVTAGKGVSKSCSGRCSGCSTDTTYQGESRTTCCCNTDGCNAATVSTTPSRVLYVMVPLAVITKLICNAISLL